MLSVHSGKQDQKLKKELCIKILEILGARALNIHMHSACAHELVLEWLLEPPAKPDQ